ncbi:MAG: cytochrome c peroxidase [Planctomycetota bacterium]
MKTAAAVTPIFCLLSLVACKSTNSEANLNTLLSDLITANQLDGNPLDGAIPPSIESPLADLGKRLFFSKSLGGDFNSACASCHHPVLGGGDALLLPIGVDAVDDALLGPGRAHLASAPGFDGGPTVPRNSPTTLNVFLWKKSLFWDGRIGAVNGGINTPDSVGFPQVDGLAGNSLSEAQARFPITSSEEMRGFAFENGGGTQDVRNHLAARLGSYGIGAGEIGENWLPLFRTAFAQPTGTAEQLIIFPNIVEAIGAYEDSQVFLDTPWKAFVGGQTSAITESAKRGAVLFYDQPSAGGFSCVSCHSGDFFTDEEFHLVGFPQLGRGKGDSVTGSNSHADFGRERVTGLREDRYAFRTPSLINVEVTGPWSHDGAFQSLSQLVRYHMSPETGWQSFNLNALPPGTQTVGCVENTNDVLAELSSQRASGVTLLPPSLVISDQQVLDLVAFLEALTDPMVLDAAAMEPWIGRNDATFTDSELLEAYDENLNPM